MTDITRKQRCIFLTLWIFEIIFLCWKATKGFGNIDESFYLTIPNRLYQGDSLITNEWYPTQFASWFCYPLFYIYKLFAESNDGIILTFRYIYIAIQSFISLFLYSQIKEYKGSIIAVLFWMIYCPFNVMAISYNTITVMGLTVFSVLLYTTYNPSKWKAVIAGISLSCSVLGCPFLIFLYFLYAILVLIYQGPNYRYKTDRYFLCGMDLSRCQQAAHVLLWFWLFLFLKTLLLIAL